MPQEAYPQITFSSFAGGLNTAQTASKIADDEFADILNFEFDFSDELKTRNGFERYNLSPDFSSRITSIFNFIQSDNTGHIIVTTGNEIYKDTAGVFSSIKGAITPISNTLWQWKAFTDLAIGVNRGLSNSIIKWSGTGNIAALALTGISGTPTRAKFIEVWNSRLWVVFDSHPNRVYYSSLGNAEDWDSSGGFIEVAFNEGDRITGIYAHKGKFFVFKRNRIYTITSGIGGVISTDPIGWSVDLITNNLGCVGQFTIQAVMDDVVFLSDEGLISFNAVEAYGDFKSLNLSRKIKELSNLNFNLDSFVSVVDPARSLYLLSVPKTSSGSVNNRIYAMDYKKINPQLVHTYLFDSIRWTIFESSVINVSALAIVLVDGIKTVFLGGDTPQFLLCKWNNDIVFTDNNQVIQKLFLSKAYSFNNLMIRKYCNSISINVGFSKQDLSSTWSLIVDENQRLTNGFTIGLPNIVAQSLWDVSIWDSGVFTSNTTNDQVAQRKVKKFNRGKKFQQMYANQQLNQNDGIKDICFDIGILTEENV